MSFLIPNTIARADAELRSTEPVETGAKPSRLDPLRNGSPASSATTPKEQFPAGGPHDAGRVQFPTCDEEACSECGGRAEVEDIYWARDADGDPIQECCMSQCEACGGTGLRVEQVANVLAGEV